MTSRSDLNFVHQLIISQLMEGGYIEAARKVSESTLTPTDGLNHRGYLAHLVRLGRMVENERGITYAPAENEDSDGTSKTEVRGLDFDAEKESETGPPPTVFPNFQTRFITTHKNACTCSAFSATGEYVATGAADNSLKLLSVSKMLEYNSNESSEVYGKHARPTTMTFYGHTDKLNEVQFHPFYEVIGSCSDDQTIRFFDYGTTSKHGFAQFTDTHNITSIHFHPEGDHLISATSHHLVRLYDLPTQKAFLTPPTSQSHTASINMIRYATDGKVFATASDDGTIKLWDSKNNLCVNTITNAHSSKRVTSVQYSRNGKYLLSAGDDDTVRLWDLTGGRELRRLNFLDSKNPKSSAPLTATFNYNESLILSADPRSDTIYVWSSRGGELMQRLTGHTGPISFLSSSPAEPHFVSCSNDFRARFWVEELNQRRNDSDPISSAPGHNTGYYQPDRWKESRHMPHRGQRHGFR